ncbi:MAG: hypothetical protein H6831_09710 [Planctomycetes bacterium]|nr:hypothetical protein [Planctomycetota bacterium]
MKIDGWPSSRAFRRIELDALDAALRLDEHALAVFTQRHGRKGRRVAAHDADRRERIHGPCFQQVENLERPVLVLHRAPKLRIETNGVVRAPVRRSFFPEHSRRIQLQQREVPGARPEDGARSVLREPGSEERG